MTQTLSPEHATATDVLVERLFNAAIDTLEIASARALLPASQVS
jgi:L-aminopeptidase/D-esterase-like protein